MPYVTEENLTDVVLERWKEIPDSRLRQIMQSLIKHLHGFVRDIEPTQAEWATAIDWLTRTGQMCSQKRQEFIMTSDVLGVSMLVDAINHRQPGKATPSTVEGPFHVPNAPSVANGGNMAEGCPGIPCFVTGTVRGLNGEPVAGAVLDLWQADGEGPLRGPAPHAGSVDARALSLAARRLLRRTDGSPDRLYHPDGRHRGRADGAKISHMRPAHIHFAITAPGYHGCITHLFHKGDKFIEIDVVYGVKEPLIVEFLKKPPGRSPTGETVSMPFYDVKYDFVLQKQAATQASLDS